MNKFKDLTGKVQACIQPRYLSGAGKPGVMMKRILNKVILDKKRG